MTEDNLNYTPLAGNLNYDQIIFRLVDLTNHIAASREDDLFFIKAVRTAVQQTRPYHDKEFIEAKKRLEDEKDKKLANISIEIKKQYVRRAQGNPDLVNSDELQEAISSFKFREEYHFYENLYGEIMCLLDRMNLLLDRQGDPNINKAW